MSRITSTKSFRKTFKFISKDLTRYFPGHMPRGLKDLQRKLKDVDCIIEMHDARIPFSGRNPNFDDVLNLRPHILIMNKQDVADLREHKKINQRIKQESGNTHIMFTNCRKPEQQPLGQDLIPLITKLIKSAPRFHRENEPQYNLMVIGVPNVGKSSLINALRSVHLHPEEIASGRKQIKAAHVGAVAGITRSVMERIKICSSPPIYIYDSPGILTPRVESVEEGMKLAVCGCMKDSLVGEIFIADYLLFMMNKYANLDYVRYYNLPSATDDILELLAWICKERNLIKRIKSPTGHGYDVQPDFTNAACTLLRTFREGNLGKMQLDIDQIHPEKYKEYKVEYSK